MQGSNDKNSLALRNPLAERLGDARGLYDSTQEEVSPNSLARTNLSVSCSENNTEEAVP